ncbi:MAG: GMP/IMP nucleotidase [Methylococcales bacterium]|jgi:putative hydrolase of the HAD superfamily
MINWNEIDTILLDMDGTLLDLHFDNFFWQELIPIKYAKKHHLSLAQAQQFLKPLFKSYEGTLNWYCLDFWSQELDLDILGLKNEIADKIAIRPHTHTFLEQLNQSERRIILVTNAHHHSLNLKMEKTQLLRFFHQVISSHSIGLPKENPLFWTKLKQIEPFHNEHTLLIDDSLNVLDSAKNHGIKYLLSINKPDSQKAKRTIKTYESVTDLDELMPLR